MKSLDRSTFVSFIVSVPNMYSALFFKHRTYVATVLLTHRGIISRSVNPSPEHTRKTSRLDYIEYYLQ